MTSVMQVDSGSTDNKQIEEEDAEDKTGELIIGLLAFCLLWGLVDILHGSSASNICRVSDKNVCCGGVSHPLIIQNDQTARLGSK